jgi:energy-coupling factor transporter ATP-binding protein EcfA2
MNSPAISVENLSFKYVGSDKPALKDINLQVESGEFIVLAGPSGCGKTTLCRAFIGLIPHFYPGEFKGSVEILGIDIQESSTYEVSQRVGYVFQNPDNQIVMTTVNRDAAFGLENLALPRQEIMERVDQVLELLELTPLAETQTHQLSGGQKQKLAIAGVLAMKPQILVLDEPTAYLSPASALQLFCLLDRLKKELGLTIFLVEHRLDLASKYSSRLIIMGDGEILLVGDPRSLFERDLSKLAGVNVPSLIEMYHLLLSRGVTLEKPPLDPEEAAEMMRRVLMVD